MIFDQYMANISNKVQIYHRSEGLEGHHPAIPPDPLQIDAKAYASCDRCQGRSYQVLSTILTIYMQLTSQ